MFWRVRRPKEGGYPDYAGESIPDDERDAAFRRGHQQHWEAIRQLTPDMMIMGNTADWHRHENESEGATTSCAFVGSCSTTSATCRI